MRIFKLSALAIGAALFIFGCAGTGSNPNTAVDKVAGNTNTPAASPQAPANDLAQAGKIYKEVCARCHKDNGEGGEVNIEGKTFKAPNFKRPSMIKDPDSELIEHIRDGGDDMPAFKDRLTATQMKELVQYIRKEFQGQ
ncbi:MAG TPA: cytochrome c [Pyrinomonadaceae bacterium]|jgi:mono/diheme cytochrome c family protein|nr:cytochrome c [Pyrinomonadaceae bacterium]